MKLHHIGIAVRSIDDAAPRYVELGMRLDSVEEVATEKVKVAVHVTLVGEPVGVKRDKGIIQHGVREIEVECLPTDIPGQLELDISELEIGNSLHVMDIDLPRGVILTSDPDDVLITVIAPKVEEEVVERPAARSGLLPRNWHLTSDEKPTPRVVAVDLLSGKEIRARAGRSVLDSAVFERFEFVADCDSHL